MAFYSPTPVLPWLTRGALIIALSSLTLRCSVLTDFSDCTTDQDCKVGERCNPARKYCEIPVAEICNDIDDDHDGVLDANEDFGTCEVPRRPGQCFQGQRKCVGSTLTCVVRSAPRTEICSNGLDDDCNGVVDDSANCVVNFPASTNVRIGSDDPATGEGDDAPEHGVCLAAYTLDRHEVANTAFLAWLNSLDPTKISVGRPAAPLNPTRTYETYYLYNDGTVRTPILAVVEPGAEGYVFSIRRRGNLFETVAYDAGALPATNVTWIAADRYCRWAGKHLPTEAEYFRATQGDGRSRLYPWGNEAPTCMRANVAVGPNSGACFGKPVAVNTLELGRSPEGVYNLYGNVDEWMWDFLDTTPNHDRNNYYQSIDIRTMPNAWCTMFPMGPLGPAMGSPINESTPAVQRCRACRFSRGRRYSSDDTRLGIRKWMDADRGEPSIGFRCATGGAPR
jgi:formylglycine-generating enzyme required for sulfatase activity